MKFNKILVNELSFFLISYYYFIIIRNFKYLMNHTKSLIKFDFNFKL